MSKQKKIVLAYSGGLDTSIILKWLQTEYGAEVITFTADLGQGEEIEPARAKALAAGEIDAFCVGEPWGSVAVETGAGVLLLPAASVNLLALTSMVAPVVLLAVGVKLAV